MIVLIAAAIVGQKTPSLMAKAKPVVETKSWVEAAKGVADYRWVNSHSVIFAKVIGEGEPARLFLYDTQAKRETEAWCSQEFGGFSGDFSTLRVSPDGTRLLWGSTGEKPLWSVATFGNDRIPSFPRKVLRMTAALPMPSDESTLMWDADSRSVFESTIAFGGNPVTMLWRRTGPSYEKEKMLPAAKGYADWQPYILGDGNAFAPSGIGAGGPKNSVGFNTWNIENPGRTRKHLTVTVPKGRSISGFAHSFSGKQVLWDLATHDAKHPGPWDVADEEIWLSDAQGKNWKLLAKMPFKDRKDDEQLSQFGSPKWVPGDKAISFVYLGKLYLFNLPR